VCRLIKRTNAPLRSTPFTIDFFSNPTHAAAAKPDVDPSHFFTPRDKLWGPAISVEWSGERAGKSTRVQQRIGHGHLLPLRALVFRPCVRGLESM
jgi:hypothetical protein